MPVISLGNLEDLSSIFLKTLFDDDVESTQAESLDTSDVGADEA